MGGTYKTLVMGHLISTRLITDTFHLHISALVQKAVGEFIAPT